MGNIAYSSVINVNREAFFKKLIEVCKELQIHPSWLMVVMKIECGFNRKAINKVSGAVGLIQWIPRFVAEFVNLPESATWLIQQRIKSMSGVEQLELIKKFLWRYRGKMTDPYQTYLAVFWPAALGKSRDYIIGDKGASGIKGKSYKWNAYLDTKYGNRDNYITIIDIEAFVDHFTPKASSQAKRVVSQPKKEVRATKYRLPQTTQCPKCKHYFVPKYLTRLTA